MYSAAESQSGRYPDLPGTGRWPFTRLAQFSVGPWRVVLLQHSRDEDFVQGHC